MNKTKVEFVIESESDEEIESNVECESDEEVDDDIKTILYNDFMNNQKQKAIHGLAKSGLNDIVLQKLISLINEPIVFTNDETDKFIIKEYKKSREQRGKQRGKQRVVREKIELERGKCKTINPLKKCETIELKEGEVLGDLKYNERHRVYCCKYKQGCQTKMPTRRVCRQCRAVICCQLCDVCSECE